jgi:hypothetical protein
VPVHAGKDLGKGLLAHRDHLFWPHRQFLICYLQIVTIWDARRGDPGLEQAPESGS